jgi:hypothetical protein
MCDFESKDGRLVPIVDPLDGPDGQTCEQAYQQYGFPRDHGDKNGHGI